MPFGFGTKHSNRSQQALEQALATQQQHSPTDSAASSGHDNLYQYRQPPPQQQYSDEPDDRLLYAPPRTNSGHADDPSTLPADQAPTRDQSHRYSQVYPTQQVHSTNSRPSAFDDATVINTQNVYNNDTQPSIYQPPVVEQKKSKSRFFHLSKSSRDANSRPASPSQSYSSTSGLGRKASKRHKDSPVGESFPSSQIPSRQLHSGWSHQSSESQVARETEKSALDAYTVQTAGENQYSGSFEDQQQFQNPRAPPTPQEPTLRVVDEDAVRQHFAEQQRQQLLNTSQISFGGVSETSQHSQYFRQTQPPNPTQGLSPLALSGLDTNSPVSHTSPDELREEQRRSLSQHNSPAESFNPQEYPQRPSVAPSPLGQQQQGPMAHQSGSAANRRSVDHKQAAPSGSRDASQNFPQQFATNQPPTPGLSQAPPQSGNPQGSGYRGGPPQREQIVTTAGGEPGRNTPSPAAEKQEPSDAHKELLIKYKKVKGLYFERTAQVEQLQNTLANQRISQSRTSLDDSEYGTRFSRLDGAVNNLAFNIRKDWSKLPVWLSPVVNTDAIGKGQKEMTAVGRACISRWLSDEIFNRVFHPGLESDLSIQLKTIEQNIRRNAPSHSSKEEDDNLTSKVVQWRLATLEGLSTVLNSDTSAEHQNNFIQICVSNLTALLLVYLNESTTEDAVKGSVATIIELAVGIASNLPLESRDLSITYPLPGEAIDAEHMKVETTLPLLENPGPDLSDRGSSNSGESSQEHDSKSQKERKEKTKSGMLAGLMGGGSSASARKASTISTVSQSAANSVAGGNGQGDGEQKVRFAGFVGVEVRGRQILVKAPVWTTS